MQRKITELMEKRKINRVALARAVGKDDSFIRDFFRGKKAGFSAAATLAIARELRADPLELLVLAAADERERH